MPRKKKTILKEEKPQPADYTGSRDLVIGAAERLVSYLVQLEIDQGKSWGTDGPSMDNISVLAKAAGNLMIVDTRSLPQRKVGSLIFGVDKIIDCPESNGVWVVVAREGDRAKGHFTLTEETKDEIQKHGYALATEESKQNNRRVTKFKIL